MKRRKKQTIKSNQPDRYTEQIKIKDPLSAKVEQNLFQLEEIFSNCTDITFKSYTYGPNQSYKAVIVYCFTLVQEQKMNLLKSTLQDLVTHEVGPANTIKLEDIIQFFTNQGVSAKSPQIINQMDQVVQHILNGHAIIFFDEWNQALSFQVLSVESRQVSEPISEAVVKGPHDSLIEDLHKNLGLLRARLKTPRFKIESFHAGEAMKTDIAYCYLEGAVEPNILTEFKRRISQIKKEEILETSYIEELIEDSTYSPFPQFRYTERPDVAVASLLEGKIIVLVSGTPSVLICPSLFVELFQASEDYYNRTVYSTFVRIMRIASFLFAVSLPSIYIALSTFHTELIPTVLLEAIINAREEIPFPTFVEALIMEFLFEMLREAGIRLPRPVGSTVSIVGALIIGEAAITAKIASPIVVIIVALTGIASFSLPQYNLAIAARVIRFPLMIFAATLGLFGIMMAFHFLLLHLTCLHSLGKPYLAPFAPFHLKDLRDTLIRAPLKILLRSPRRRYPHQS
mgnify:CR=1 FL=1